MKQVKEPKSEEPKPAGRTSKERHTKEAAASAQDKPSVRTKTAAKTESTEFEKLQCPELDPRISCAQLHQLCSTVKLESVTPASYFSTAKTHYRWEELEPEWMVPIPPSTDPLAEKEPMMARFEEIWCPLLADVEESLSIIPPTFQYFSDGTVMHSAIY